MTLPLGFRSARLLLLVCLCTSGCGKHAPVPAAPAASESSQAEAATPDSQGAAGSQAAAPPAVTRTDPAPDPTGAGAGQAIIGVVDPNLTVQLRIFIQQKGRLPETFAEFAGARLDSVPRLQPGLTFAIDASTHEVKIVRKPK